MKIIKLNAIDSTNSFLKDLSRQTPLKNFTVVVTNNQQKGRGQMNSNWLSEPFKNLTFSVLINKFNIAIQNSKYINFAASLAIYDTLLEYKIPNLFIKWPNDILSENKKICGILVENTFTSLTIKNSIIGFGLNVNQKNFQNLTNVTSLKNLTSKEFNLDDMLVAIVKNLKKNIELLNSKNFKTLESNYLNALYKKGIFTSFKDKNNCVFSGKIIGISKNGNLEIQLENKAVKQFAIKEVSFL